jgi:hypothetical protein
LAGTADSRLGQAERREVARVDAERALADFRVARRRRGEAHPPLPCEPLRRQPVRSRHIGKGAGIRRDIGQEQPRLDGRMKGVGVERRLRVGRPVMGVPQDALDPHDRFGVAAADIADQPTPFGVAQQPS